MFWPKGDTYDIIATEQSLWMWELLAFKLRKRPAAGSGDLVYLEVKKKLVRISYR